MSSTLLFGDDAHMWVFWFCSLSTENHYPFEIAYSIKILDIFT